VSKYFSPHLEQTSIMIFFYYYTLNLHINFLLNDSTSTGVAFFYTTTVSS
jgi:hypothetical protein